MNKLVEYSIRKQKLWLSADKCIFWEAENALIISDLHFGKTGHFRKNGIAVPTAVYEEDLKRLLSNIQYFKAQQLIVVGDMFHSIANKELNEFEKWRNDISHVQIDLIKGNHDILSLNWYNKLQIQTHESALIIKDFLFVHDIADIKQENANAYVFCGHIHPGILLKGLSRQRLRFPCFWFGEQYAVLPAFSRFTGIMPQKKNKNDEVFAIVNDTIVKV